MNTHMNLSQSEVKTLPQNSSTNNIISSYNYGNVKIIVKDNYINENNIKLLETTLENLYTNVKITITKNKN